MAAPRIVWEAVLVLPLLAPATWVLVSEEPAIPEQVPVVKVGGLTRAEPAEDRWRDPTEEDEYAARAELKKALTDWRSMPPNTSSAVLTPPMVRIVKRWPRTDAGWRASLILCPMGGDPIEDAWHAVNRPFRREVPREHDEALLGLRAR